jgi:hypothetical protein
MAQSVNGDMRVTAWCGNTTSQPCQADVDTSIIAHGACVSSDGAVASINDAAALVRLQRGMWRADCSAASDFRGTYSDQGSAEGSAYPAYNVNDLVFTDTNNPTAEGYVPMTMNYYVRAHVLTTGLSNCNPGYPTAGINFAISIGGGASGDYHVIRGTDMPGAESAFETYPNDGSISIQATRPGSVYLGSPTSLTIGLSSVASVLYCDSPPADLGSAEGMVEVGLLSIVPVFNLPPGITANCPSLHIVDNHWQGTSPCGSADFNGDGDVGTDGDIEAFFQCLGGSCCAACDPHGADFNGDGDLGTDADIEGFFRVLGGGPC